MAAATSTLQGLDKIIREDLMFQERILEPRVDGIFSKMYDTAEGVITGGGRVGSATGGFTVIHTFATGVAGAFKNIPGGGDTDRATDDTGQTIVYNPSVTFPGATDATAPGYVQKTITLVEGLGVFALPLHLIMAEQLDATIAKPVSLTIKGTAKNVAQSEANNFYSTTLNRASVLCIVHDISDALTDNTDDIVLAFNGNLLDIEGRVGRFYPGQTVDMYDDQSFTNKINSVLCVVTNVDYVDRTVAIATADSSNIDAGQALVDGMVVVLAGTGAAGTVGVGPSGIDYWTANDQSDIFGINQTTHSQFNSVVTAVGNVLDQSVLDTNIGAFFDAYSDMCELDSMITTAGVINNYIENTDGLWRYERHNTGALKLKEGWTSFDYTYQGRNFELLQSRYITNGYLYACKLADQNLKRYVPPRIPSAGKRSEFAPEIQWLGPIVGSNSIFLPARNSSAKLTRFVEAPFFCQREVCPEQLQGVKLTGLTELFV